LVSRNSVRKSIGEVQLNLWADVDKNVSFGSAEMQVGGRNQEDEAAQLFFHIASAVGISARNAEL
jgi:hypothetical protein